MVKKKRFISGKPKSNDITHLFVGGIVGLIVTILFVVWFMDYLGVPF